MPDDLEVSVEDLLAQLKRKGIPLQSEIGAFIALEACEQLSGAPVALLPRDIVLGEIGEILVEPSGARCAEADAVRALLRLLGELLVCAAPGVSPMLLELVEKGPSEGQWTLERLQGDLEACLLPLNRGATRRVLARLLREVHREGDRASQRPSDAPDAAALDAELDGLFGGECSSSVAAVVRPKPVTAGAAPAVVVPSVATGPSQGQAKRSDETVDVELDSFDEIEPDTSAAAPKQPVNSADASLKVDVKVPVKTKTKTPNLDFGEELFDGEPKAHGSGAILGGMFVLIAVVLAVAYATLGQRGARTLLGLEQVEQARSAPQPAAAPVAPSVGELRVSSTPGRAQVFLLVGSGPALAGGLPVGVAHEFVALAEGHVPSRALVASDASWEQTPDGARYELAVQTGKALAPGEALDLGPSLLPSSVGTPTGALGTVRVITTPRGAKVYQLVGFTPEVRVQNLELSRGYDVLVYAPGYQTEQRHLEAGDFQGEGPARVAALDIVLRKTTKR